MFLVCVLSVVVTFTWPLWNMFLITAYGRSPGALCVLCVCFAFFLLYLVGGRVLRGSWLRYSLCRVLRSIRGLGIQLLRVLIGQFDYLEQKLWSFLFLLLNHSQYLIYCVICSRSGIFHLF